MKRVGFRWLPPLAFAAVGASAAIAAAPIDYAREARWAAEVVPSLVVGEAIGLSVPPREKVLAILTEPPAAAKGGVVLVHGLGVHPDFGVVGALRTQLSDAGFVTLSVQMPVLAADAPREDYGVTFAEAGERIAAALKLLRNKGLAPLAIVSHSMGASMTNAYLGRMDALPVDAWVAVGMPVSFARAPRQPVLDVLAQDDLPAVVASAPERARALRRDCSRQITIRSADHYFDREAKALGEAIAQFLERVAGGACGERAALWRG